MPRVIVCDVNETLLDVAALEPNFKEVFADARVLQDCSVSDALEVPIGRLRLVAAHAWDIVGALRVGCSAAFVARPGKVLYPLGPQPDIVGSDFRSVA